MTDDPIFNLSDPQWRQTDTKPIVEGTQNGAFYTNGEAEFYIKESFIGAWIEKAFVDAARVMGAKVAPCFLVKGVDKFGRKNMFLASQKLAEEPVSLSAYVMEKLPGEILPRDLDGALLGLLIDEQIEEHEQLAKKIMSAFDKNAVMVAALGLLDTENAKHVILDRAQKVDGHQIDIGDIGMDYGLGDYKRLNPFMDDKKLRTLAKRGLTLDLLDQVTGIFYKYQDMMVEERCWQDPELRLNPLKDSRHNYQMGLFDRTIAKIVTNFGMLAGLDIKSRADAHRQKTKIRSDTDFKAHLVYETTKRQANAIFVLPLPAASKKKSRPAEISFPARPRQLFASKHRVPQAPEA